MQLRITVVVGRRFELAVDCAPGTAWADVLAQLTRSQDLALPDEAECRVGSEPLADSALVGVPPLLDGVVVSGRPTGPAHDSDPPSLLHLHVTSGPDAGAVFALGGGVHRLGRGVEADLRVQDPQLSRLQLQISVTGAGATVCDLTSTNGSRVAGTGLTVQPQRWRVGDRLHAGSTVLELRAHGSPSTATTLDKGGHLQVNRLPRILPPIAPVEIRLPERPPSRPAARVPLLAMAMPLLLAVPLAWVQHSPTYLLFGLMSPAMMLGSSISDRRGGRRADRQAEASWRRDYAATQHRLEAALAAEGERRRASHPGCAELLVTVEQRLERLWERSSGDADALVLRIGLADQAAEVHRVASPPSVDEPRMLADLPVLVDLRQVGVLGIAGPTRGTAGLARALVAQLSGWHSPRDVRLVILSADDASAAGWRWATLLPHCRPDRALTCHAAVGSLDAGDQVHRRLVELERLMTDRRAATPATLGRPWSGPSVVVVLDGARRLRGLAGIPDLLAQGPSVGIRFICIEGSRANLPVECRAYVELPSPLSVGSGEALVSRPAEPPLAVVSDAVSEHWAARFARALAPLRDATPTARDHDLPATSRLLDLLDDSAIHPPSLAEKWATTPASTEVPIGMSADGPYVVDLRHDGPHLLVGGTTGAGKSELLQTLIASLAIANRPDQLTFVLVDYKGGAAFDECARLPHTVGFVTDLDPQLGERALVSLTAELKHREGILRAAGAKDLEDHIARLGASGGGLARLVVVIDEFRMIAEDLPEFLEGMVRIAAVGRSLGVHLVLATQRPAGIVSADIAANVNLRIALRVRDQVDSQDVIDAPDAATLDAHQPGRAYARSGSRPLELFQTARVAGSGDREKASACRVQLVTTANLGDPPAWAGPRVDVPGVAARTDLARITDSIIEATRILDLPATRRPWLPPLPDVVTLDQLDSAGTPWLAPYAVVDRPGRQSQLTLGWDLAEDTHLAVVGTMRSGRSTLLRTLSGSLASHFSPDQVHVHAIDGGSGALLALTRLPQVGVVAGSDQPARGVRLLDRLTEEVARRRDRFGRAGHSSLAEQHRSVAAQQQLPYLVLLIDSWESVSGAWEAVDHGRPIEALQQLMRDGPAVGLRVGIAGDRGLLTSRVGSLVRDKLVLRLADPVDLALAGIPTAAVPTHLPPGRGLRSVDQAEVQVALLARDPTGVGQIAALDCIAARSQRSGAGAGPLRIEPLPARLSVGDVVQRVGDRPPGWALVGAGGDAVEPLGLSLRGTTAVVAGPARSGRSTALLTVAQWLSRRGTEVVVVTAGPSPLSELAGPPGIVEVVESGDPRRLAGSLDARPGCCVVVDDVERLLDTEAEDVVLQWFTSGVGPSRSLVVAGNTSDLTSMFRGLSVVARRSGQGVLLQPSSYTDGDLLGVRIGATDLGARIPGRGVLVHDGCQHPVQVATWGRPPASVAG